MTKHQWNQKVESKEDLVKRYNKKHVIKPKICKLRHCNNKAKKGQDFCTKHDTYYKRVQLKIDIEI